MNLTYYNILKLEKIRKLITMLPAGLFVKQQAILNNATIGQHIRHILEFYQRVIVGAEYDEICYDDRERDQRIESDPDYAIKLIYELTSSLNRFQEDKHIIFKASYSDNEVDKERISSSLKRELAYALDHTVHHLAIVKIVLSVENVKVDPTLGVAPSTLRYNHEYSN